LLGIILTFARMMLDFFVVDSPLASLDQQSLDQQLLPALAERQAQQLYRQRRVVDSASGVDLVVDEKNYLSFCSNDYLGLANHPEVISAFKTVAYEFGVGSTASHLVCGHSRYHHELEEAFAAWLNRPRALLFSTGYMANIGVLNALLSEGDQVFEDKLNHASLLDGGLSSGAKFQRFLHNDVKSLEQKLSSTVSSSWRKPGSHLASEQDSGLHQNDGRSRKLIAVDGVFSMDGDLAPLPELSEIAQKNNAWLMSDDAHAIGVLGKTGAGCAEHFNLDVQQLPIVMATLGKGLGTFGAIVAGSDALIETLIQFSRTYIYTTALPPAVAAATLASVKLAQTETWRREKLHTLIARFRAGAAQLGLPLMQSETPIQPILIGDSAEALRISSALAQRGIWISAIRPPTVPNGTARLRITFSAAHTDEQIDYLLENLSAVMAAR
jgi:8-amino-7-oxononanoate synthase